MTFSDCRHAKEHTQLDKWRIGGKDGLRQVDVDALAAFWHRRLAAAADGAPAQGLGRGFPPTDMVAAPLQRFR